MYGLISIHVTLSCLDLYQGFVDLHFGDLDLGARGIVSLFLDNFLCVDLTMLWDSEGGWRMTKNFALSQSLAQQKPTSDIQ